MPKAERPKANKDVQLTKPDVILSLVNTPKAPYMDEILSGRKTYEFRRYALKRAERVWIYVSAPASALKYVCEIEAMPKRGDSDWEPLPPSPNEENQKFNSFDPTFVGFDYAYKILTVYELHTAIPLQKLKSDYDIKAAPQGWRYLPESIKKAVNWKEQKLLVQVGDPVSS